MELAQELHDSARACEGAALALSRSLRPSAAQTQNPNPALRDTFREAEAFAITCRAVMEELAPILPLLADGAAVVGKTPRVLKARVTNGFDSLAVVLLTLFDAATNAILDVAGNRSRWLVSPLQATATFERMVTHHGQLRAMYGIMHLASKIVRHADVSSTLFVDVSGADAHPELEPGRWRAAIRMDDFYGRCFGFHYAPEMRNVLRVVNIARGSVHKSHADGDPSPQLIKNVAMLGWGWIYSNMVIMDSLGLSIDGVSQIGADDNRGMSISALRKFMNLVEEPLVAGVTGLASADVAIDTLFEVPPPGAPGGLEAIESGVHDEAVKQVLMSITTPVSVRLMSHKNRPIDLASTSVPGTPNRAQGENHSTAPRAQGDQRDATSKSVIAPCEAPKPADSRGGEHNVLAGGGATNASTEISYPSSNPAGARASGANEKKERRTPASSPKRSKGISEVLTGAAESSYLASTIKTELIKFQSNVSTFLGLEEAKPARGLVMHFHGGGFVSQSTTSHQAYMKEWCADVPDLVLFSVDYKLAPEHKFPVALHECVYAYIWALQNASRLGTLAERIVFAGDSAGGNLAVATAMMVAELGIRGPDGICLGYPALYVNVAWSPSRLLSFFDPMLPLSVMELCVKSYLPDGPEGQGREVALLSPVVASEEQLRKLPRIAMVCGSLDPLLDDAVLFAHRLRMAGRDWDVLRIYESMPHGFLNMSQVNVTARSGMRFLAKMIAEYADLPIRPGSKARDPNESGSAAAEANAAAEAFDG